MKKIANKTMFIAAFFIIAGFIFAGCGDKAAKATEETLKVPVQVVNPEKLDYQESLSFSGVTMPPVITMPSFLVAGKVKELNFQVGQHVKKGQILAQLDSEMYEKQLNTTSSAVNLAEANLNKVNAGARKQEKEIVRQQMMQAQHNYDLAKSEMDRFGNLYKLDAIPKRQYEGVLTQYNLAKDQLKASQENYNLVKEGASKEDKQIATANVNLARSNQEAVSTQLSYTNLISPVDGVITEKKVEVGVVVGAGTPIYEIHTVDYQNLVVMIPSVHIEKISIGQTAEVEFLDNPSKKYNAVVSEIKPASEMPTNSYRVKLRISDSAYSGGYSGNIAKATFRIGNRISSYAIPLACLQKGNGDKRYQIFIINGNDSVKKIPVRLLKIKDGKTLISGDVNEKTKVVLSGQDYLKDGSVVKIVDVLDSMKNVTPDKESKTAESGEKL